jgi:LemA protein
MLWIAIAVWLVVMVLIAFVVIGFNKLRRADVAAQEALGGIDVQLTRRADLIPNLVNTVKGYATHERSVFDRVTSARALAQQAAHSNSVTDKVVAQTQLDNAVVRVLAVAEAYPDLKASANFTQLQSQLADTENQLSFARQYYNDAVSTLNTLTATLPWTMFAGLAKVTPREFFRAPAGTQDVPDVSFEG